MATRYPAEFRERAVELARLREKPVKQLAADLGISDQTLHNMLVARCMSRAPDARAAALIPPADVPEMILNGLGLPAGTCSAIALATPA